MLPLELGSAVGGRQHVERSPGNVRAASAAEADNAVGFVSSQARERIYVAFGAVAAVFSLAVGAIFLFGLEAGLPDLGAALPF